MGCDGTACGFISSHSRSLEIVVPQGTMRTFCPAGLSWDGEVPSVRKPLLAEESPLVVLDLTHTLQIEHVLDGGDAALHAVDAAFAADLGESLAHGADRGANRMIAPDQQPDLSERTYPRHRHLGIGGRHQGDRRPAIPR